VTFYADDQVTLYHGDAGDVLPTLPSASVHLLLVDPPYFKAKMDYLGEQVTWDRQWATPAAYLAWLDALAQEWQRVLAPNGSLYCFASPRMAAHVEVLLAQRFTVLNSLVWVKADKAGNGQWRKAHKAGLRAYFPQTERILFCEQPGADSMALGSSGYAAQCEHLHGHVFEPIRAYLDGERQRAGIPRQDCNTACGVAAMASGHYFTQSQWALPTAPHYHALRDWFNRYGRAPAPPFTDYHPAGSAFARFHPTPAEFLRTDYESLRTDYESLRRPFTVTTEVPYTDTWHFTTVPPFPGKHPAEKPLPLLRHMIAASSRPGDVVLDCCAGSGSTLVAAQEMGRQAVGIEMDADWCAAITSRLQGVTV